jgi:hypothetical protein
MVEGPTNLVLWSERQYSIVDNFELIAVADLLANA